MHDNQTKPSLASNGVGDLSIMEPSQPLVTSYGELNGDVGAGRVLDDDNQPQPGFATPPRFSPPPQDMDLKLVAQQSTNSLLHTPSKDGRGHQALLTSAANRLKGDPFTDKCSPWSSPSVSLPSLLSVPGSDLKTTEKAHSETLLAQNSYEDEGAKGSLVAGAPLPLSCSSKERSPSLPRSPCPQLPPSKRKRSSVIIAEENAPLQKRIRAPTLEASTNNDAMTTSTWWQGMNVERIDHARESCQPSEWLNDDVINATLEIFTSLHPRLHTFSSLLLTEHALPESGCQAIQYILPREKLRSALAHSSTGDDATETNIWHLDNISFMLVILISNNHWVFVHVEVGRRRATIVDSMPSEAHEQEVEALLRIFVTRYLGAQIPDLKDWAKWSCSHRTWIRQENTSDCGVYALATGFYTVAHFLASREDPLPALATLDFLPKSINVETWRRFLSSLFEGLRVLGQPSPTSTASENIIQSHVVASLVPKQDDSLDAILPKLP